MGVWKLKQNELMKQKCKRRSEIKKKDKWEFQKNCDFSLITDSYFETKNGQCKGKR